MSATVGMAGGIEIWAAAWMGLALALTGASVLCGLADLRRPRRPWRAFMAAALALAMVVSTLDMALPGTLLSPLAWAALLLTLMLASLPGIRSALGSDRRSAAQHAAGLLFMATMWLAMLPPVPAAGTDAAAPVTVHAAHAHAVGSLALPLGWALIAASALVVVLVVAAARRWAERPSIRQRCAAAQHASMGLAMSAMTVGMIVPLVLG
ncbi:hypothetical protein [Cryobacterium sp. PH29-G1]|uniref:hypothetical protein n=1 Tax=Cryobacterium sp. PH29-G1 TaxID=3046211 RepID=UPI0024BAAEA1|nr:hypothetical protein [Cryobacterium sp. PH29-G1]MDJ0348040.1 hypothetical protein [Cryobacterium sp. PH29-G1]